jgi:hypothetical protein
MRTGCAILGWELLVRPLSKGSKRQFVSLATALSAILIYLPFIGSRWAIYLAISTSYTVAVFGLAWSDGKIPLFLSGRVRSVGAIIQVHIAFLLLLVLWIWAAQYSKPYLPAWALAEDGYGSWFLVFALLGIIAILLFEHWWLASKPKSDVQNSQAPSS